MERVIAESGTPLVGVVSGLASGVGSFWGAVREVVRCIAMVDLRTGKVVMF